MAAHKSTVVIIGEGVALQSIPHPNPGDIIVTLELSAELELKQRNLPALYFHRYAQSKGVWQSTVADARKWLESWPTKPILKGQSAIDVFRFDDTSLWWCVYDAIWEARNGIFDTFYQVKTLLSLIRDYRPATVELHGIFDFDAQEIMDSLARICNFDLKIENYTVRPKTGNELTKSKGKLKLLVRFLLLKAARAFARKNIKNLVVFFLDHGSKTIERYRNGVCIISDHYLEGLEDYMTQNRDENLFVSMNMPTVSSSFSRNFLTEILRTLRGIYIPWICYYSISDLKKGMKLISYYQNKVLDLEKDPGFKESMIMDGADVYPLLRDVFRGNLPRALALVHLEIELASKFLDKEQPNLIFHVTGMSPTGRALSLACNKRNIRVIAPQLGIISPELPVNTSFLIMNTFENKFLPEYLVWGPFYKSLIIGRGYPESLVKIVGFWRTEKDEAEPRMLPTSGDYVLYVAGANLGKLSYILSLDEELSTIRLIRKTIPREVGLVVKLHPSLPYDSYNKKLHDIIDEITLIGGPNAPSIEEFLPRARIVVGKASTVLLQALILGKPVIAANFGSELNFLGFQGVPFATTPKEFEVIVKNILDNGWQGFNVEPYCSTLGRNSVSLIIKEIRGEN